MREIESHGEIEKPLTVLAAEEKIHALSVCLPRPKATEVIQHKDSDRTRQISRWALVRYDVDQLTDSKASLFRDISQRPPKLVFKRDARLATTHGNGVPAHRKSPVIRSAADALHPRASTAREAVRLLISRRPSCRGARVTVHWVSFPVRIGLQAKNYWPSIEA